MDFHWLSTDSPLIRLRRKLGSFSIICNLWLHQVPVLGTNPEKASNIMACRKMVNYFMAAVIPIYSLHFAKYNFPIEIQTRKSFERLLSTTYTANVSFLLHAFKELGSSLCVKPLLALQGKPRVIFYTQVRVFFYYSRVSRE